MQWQALLTFTLPLVLVLLMTSAAILLFALQRRSPYHPYPGLLCSDSNTSQGPLETSKTGDSWKVSLLPLLGGLVPDMPRGRTGSP